MVKKEKEVKTEDVKKTTKKETKKVTKKEIKKKEKSKDVTPHGFKAFKLEFTKVKWPTKKEMIKYTIATFAFTIFFAVLFNAILWLISLIKNMI